MTLLLAVLFVVVLYAWRDVARRKARNDWKRTLDVAIATARTGAAAEVGWSRIP